MGGDYPAATTATIAKTTAKLSLSLTYRQGADPSSPDAHGSKPATLAHKCGRSRSKELIELHEVRSASLMLLPLPQPLPLPLLCACSWSVARTLI